MQGVLKHEKKKMKVGKEESFRASRPTAVKESNEDIRFLKCF
jgi:hypothetical protein